jgi:poly(A) polymerase
MTADLLRRLRLPGELVATAASLVRYHMLPLPHGERAVRRFIHRRRELLPDLLKLMLADREAARGRLASAAARARYRLAVSAILAALDATPEPRPLLTGDDVMTLLRLAPGPRVGEALAVLGEAQALGDVLGREDAELALLRYAAAQGWTRERES